MLSEIKCINAVAVTINERAAHCTEGEMERGCSLRSQILAEDVSFTQVLQETMFFDP